VCERRGMRSSRRSRCRSGREREERGGKVEDGGKGISNALRRSVTAQKRTMIASSGSCKEKEQSAFEFCRKRRRPNSPSKDLSMYVRLLGMHQLRRVDIRVRHPDDVGRSRSVALCKRRERERRSARRSRWGRATRELTKDVLLSDEELVQHLGLIRIWRALLEAL